MSNSQDVRITNVAEAVELMEKTGIILPVRVMNRRDHNEEVPITGTVDIGTMPNVTVEGTVSIGNTPEVKLKQDRNLNVAVQNTANVNVVGRVKLDTDTGVTTDFLMHPPLNVNKPHRIDLGAVGTREFFIYSIFRDTYWAKAIDLKTFQAAKAAGREIPENDAQTFFLNLGLAITIQQI